MYDYLITHAAYLNAIQACEDTRISLGVQKDILLENVSKLKAGNEGETVTAFENTMKTLVEATSYASAVSKLEGMQTILEEELPKVNTLLRYVNNLDSQLDSAYYRTPVAAGEEYVPPGEGKLALNEASANAVVEKCRHIQEINEEIRMRFRSMLIALEGYLPESGQLQEALEKACNKVNRIENLEKAVTRYAADVKELSDDLKYRLAALTDNPEEVRFASGWNSTTQEEVVLLKLVEGPPVLKEHASELSNLEGISKESVIKEIEAYWNQEDGYFDENWWQDETKKRESLNILLLESLLTEDENGNVGGYDLMEHYTQTMPGSAKRYALQILFHLEPQDGDDEIVLNNIAGACSKRGIDLIGNGWVIPPEMMQFYVAYHELLEQEHDMEMKRALSIVLNFVPIVGEVKSIWEAIGGEDLLTGEELTGFERILGIAAAFLDVLLFAKWAKNASKGIKYIDDIPDAAYKGGKEIIEEGLEGTIKSGSKTIFNSTPELEAHIKNIDPSVPRKRGIGGAHNSKEFFKNDVAIVSETPSKIPGVKTVEYRMPKLNADGTPTGEYGARVFKKTIYDPDIISDDEFIKRGLEAANDAISKADDGIMPREWTGVDIEGITWHGYFEDGEITSFFPDE